MRRNCYSGVAHGDFQNVILMGRGGDLSTRPANLKGLLRFAEAEVAEKPVAVVQAAEEKVYAAVAVEISSRHARAVVQHAILRAGQIVEKIREGDAGLSGRQRVKPVLLEAGTVSSTTLRPGRLAGSVSAPGAGAVAAIFAQHQTQYSKAARMTKALGFAEMTVQGMGNSRRRKSLFCFVMVGGVMEKALAAGEATG